MPLFEIGEDELVPFRRVQAGPDLYEKEIEELLWANPDAFVGTPLFPVARQPALSGKLRPDVVALDDRGHVHVIEVKRDIARDQLAQCLEYAGWALDTSLDVCSDVPRRRDSVFQCVDGVHGHQVAAVDTKATTARARRPGFR